MTRLALVALVVLASGCGPLRHALSPSLISVPRLAPNVVTDPDASTASVTATAPGRGVSGRVLDRETGIVLAGVSLDVTDASGAVARVQTDLDGAFQLPAASGVAGIAAREVCFVPLAARPDVAGGQAVTLVVLLAPVTC